MGLNFCPKASALILVTCNKRNIGAFKKFSESLVYMSVVCFLLPGLLPISNLKHKQEILCNCNRGCIVLQQGDSMYATFQSLLWKGEENLKKQNNNNKNLQIHCKIMQLKETIQEHWISFKKLVKPKSSQEPSSPAKLVVSLQLKTLLRLFTTQLQHFYSLA